MRRREFITLLTATATSWPVAVSAQQASKTYRLAYLELASSDDAAIVKKRLRAWICRRQKSDFRLTLCSRRPWSSVQTRRRFSQNQSGYFRCRFRHGHGQGGTGGNFNNTCRLRRRRRSDRIGHCPNPQPPRCEHHRSRRAICGNWWQAAGNP